MTDQTSNEISHVQSVNRGREGQRNKIKTNLSKETQNVLQKKTEELGVDKVKKQISIFFKTPFDRINKL
jgi:RNase P/RNase MRP subunit p29